MTKKPRKVRTKSNAPGAAGAAAGGGEAGPGHNGEKTKPKLSFDEEQSLFLHHRTQWNAWLAKRGVVDKLETEMKAALKNDGFTVKQMKIADDLPTVKGEKKIVAEVRERLQVARWLGHPMGNQLDLFDQPDRTPVTDVAYQLGKRMSMQNQPLKPPYSPDTEAYRACAAGYHDHQRELAGGLKAPSDANQSSSAHQPPAH